MIVPAIANRRTFFLCSMKSSSVYFSTASLPISSKILEYSDFARSRARSSPSALFLITIASSFKRAIFGSLVALVDSTAIISETSSSFIIASHTARISNSLIASVAVSLAYLRASLSAEFLAFCATRDFARSNSRSFFVFLKDSAPALLSHCIRVAVHAAILLSIFLINDASETTPVPSVINLSSTDADTGVAIPARTRLSTFVIFDIFLARSSVFSYSFFALARYDFAFSLSPIPYRRRAWA